MRRDIMFIHGMFFNPLSWEEWQAWFEARGYHCGAPAWPLHEGDPAALRAHLPAGLGTLSLEAVVEAMTVASATLHDPILIGHSVGGLVAQILASRGIGSAVVAICPVAPNRMLSFDWGFFRNSAAITNPLKGDAPFPMDADGFFRNFGNTMTREASDAAFERYGLSESRNVLRDCMGELGMIDVDRPHPPMLFIGAEKDQIIPPALVERNAKAYTDFTSRADYLGFGNRGHFICGHPVGGRRRPRHRMAGTERHDRRRARRGDPPRLSSLHPATSAKDVVSRS